MKTSSLVLGLLLLLPATMSAQETTKAVMPPLDYNCLLATDEAAWMELGLNEDQADRAIQVREACQSECSAAKTGGAVATKLLAGYEAELKGILSTEQYTKWITWCKEHPARSVGVGGPK